MKIWTTIINKNIKGAFIIEDDIEIQNYDMFKIEKKHILEIIKNKSGPLFMTINSKQIYHKPFVKFNTCTVNFSKDVEKIMDPFLGLHFYYVNKEMCEFLIENISMISYQIDIEIGLLSKVNKYRPLYFLNYKTDILTQNNKFMSDIQPFYYSPTSLSIILKIPVDISTTIYHYIPAIFKLKREDLKYENVSRERINSIISY
jgi:GR25 family glycosyltransferase involved in LPS biosynthesis